MIDEINELLCYPYMIGVSCLAYLLLKYLFKNPSNQLVFLVLLCSGGLMFALRFWIDSDAADPDNKESLLLSFCVAAVAHEAITRLILSKFNSTNINKGGVV